MKLTKSDVREHCIKYVKDKIDLLVQAIDDAQSSANNETKSSAGDKHETSRAMAQIERERLSGQLSKLKTSLNTLNRIDTSAHDTIKLGSYVSTEAGNFYISIGLGKMSVDGDEFFTISPISPVGKILIGKCQGDEFILKNKQVKILSVT